MPPAGATTSSAGQPASADEQLRQAIQDEVGESGDVTSVTAPAAGPVTVTWEIRPAGSPGLTENNARFAVMRIMRAIQESQLAAGGDAPAATSWPGPATRSPWSGSASPPRRSSGPTSTTATT